MVHCIAINGYGRIGRNVLRAVHERGDCGLEIVAINDPADAETNAYLTRYDTVHRRWGFSSRMLDTTRAVLRAAWPSCDCAHLGAAPAFDLSASCSAVVPPSLGFAPRAGVEESRPFG